MGIFSRFTDIVNSNIVAMLDKAEDPEKMIRLMIQEMEDTLVELKSEAAKIIADKKTVQRQLIDAEKDIQKWQTNAETAVDKGRDDLAKLALEEKALRTDNMLNVKKDLDSCEDALLKYRDEIHVLEEKLKDAKSRQKAIIRRQKTAKHQLESRKTLAKANGQQCLKKFDQFERSIERIEGEVEASTMGPANLEDEFRKLNAEKGVEEELLALKKKMNKDS